MRHLPLLLLTVLRLDVTRHVYNSFGYRRGVWSFGVGFAGGPRRRK